MAAAAVAETAATAAATAAETAAASTAITIMATMAVAAEATATHEPMACTNVTGVAVGGHCMARPAFRQALLP